MMTSNDEFGRPDRERSRVTLVEQQAGEVTLRARVRAHVALTKPRIVELLLATAIPTMFLAAGGLPPLVPTIGVLIGGTLAAGSANTFNSVYDRDIDALMARTYHRPAALGIVSVRAGMVQGVLLGVLSALVLWATANVLSAMLALVAIVFYAVVYTMILKRRTSQNIVWGGAAGCMPVLIAWAAVTDSLSWTPVVLFLIVFFWTPPHYWPLAMRFREDYAAAGVPMLPVVKSDAEVVRSILWYSWVMVGVSLALVPIAPMGWVYAVGATVLGIAFLWQAYSVRKAVRRSDAQVTKVAMRLFHGSITYLALLFLLVALEPFVP
jgi:heme o synthase